MARRNTDFGVFYDNSIFNFEGQENYPGILCVKIFETDEEDEDKKSFISGSNRDLYLRIIKRDERYPYILDILDNDSRLKDDMVDHLSGLNERQMDCLMKLIDSNKINVKFVILDFDRTMTKIEGILDAEVLLDEIPPDVVAKYYFGGARRLKKIHQLFDFLERKRIDCFILTNNEALDYIYRILNVAKLIREPLKYIYYNTEKGANGEYNKLQTLYNKLSRVPKYRNVFNNRCSQNTNTKLSNYLETCDNRDNGDSLFR